MGFGYTGYSFPCIHSTSRSLPCGSPMLFQCRTPSTVGHFPLWSAEMILPLSSECVFATASCSTWPLANASADVGSIEPEPPPYFLRYALTNALLPGAFESGNQSPVLKMPSTFLRPTLLGNSAGSFGPFDRNKNFGLNFSCTIAFTCA